VKKIWLAPVLLLFLLIAQTAEGSVLSTLFGFLTSSVGQVSALVKKEEEIKTETNSQNLDLPEPTMSIATSSPKAELDQAITGGSAIAPETGPLGTSADLKDNQAPSDLISVYTIHEGDTIGIVAKMFNVSPNTVLWANDLKKGSALKPGETLVILPITGVQHIVKKGDTVKSIAKKYGGDVEEIAVYNDLDLSKDLIVGSTVIVPNGEESTIISGPKAGQKAPAKYKGPSYSGYYMRPISGGMRTQGIHGNNAVDLASKIGTPIYAAAQGRVIIAKTGGWNGGYGNYVVIAHPNGTQTLYGHMNKVMTSVGARVDKGDQIGQLGSTGHSTGPHVHFELRGASNPF
jgi:LysM repeat protein